MISQFLLTVLKLNRISSSFQTCQQIPCTLWPFLSNEESNFHITTQRNCVIFYSFTKSKGQRNYQDDCWINDCANKTAQACDTLNFCILEVCDRFPFVFLYYPGPLQTFQLPLLSFWFFPRNGGTRFSESITIFLLLQRLTHILNSDVVRPLISSHFQDWGSNISFELFLLSNR